MGDTKKLAEQTRSLIDHLHHRQAMIASQYKSITNETSGTLKKSKSVSFLDDELEETNTNDIRASTDRIRPRSILKKTDDPIDDSMSSPEPFVVNIPNNISRIDIDQYLRDVKDQRRKGLNYSYTTDDDDDEDDENVNAHVRVDPIRQEPQGKDESWTELKHWRSLFDEGNDRDAYYNNVRSLNHHEQSWTTDNVEQIKKRIEDRQAIPSNQQQQQQKRKTSSVSPKKRSQQTAMINREKVLLGYDVVAGLLDNEKSSFFNEDNPLSESYLDELASFRKKNLDQSLSSSYSLANEIDIADFSKEIDILPPDAFHNSHTCIHSFTLNDRLFTVPTNPDINGQSRCPICSSLRKEPNSNEPQYARVSIPKYRVNSNAYHFRPQKRSNLSDSKVDSVALTNHCLAGFNTARMAPLDKSAKSLDLRTESGTQLELSKMSLEDAQRLGNNHDLCETDLQKRGTALRYHMNTLFQERLRRLRKSTDGPEKNASIISQIDVR